MHMMVDSQVVRGWRVDLPTNVITTASMITTENVSPTHDLEIV